MLDDPQIVDLLNASMVARIATLSRNGRPNINPLYFVVVDGHIHLGTADRTLAARNVESDPRVSLLFENERNPTDRRLLRLAGSAVVRRDDDANRAYRRGVTRKYMATPSGLRDMVTHWRQALLLPRYMRSGDFGAACVIEVAPESTHLIDYRY